MKHSELGERLNPLLHRECPKCEARMWLALIEPEPRGLENLVFECVWCRHREVVVLDLNRVSYPRTGPRREEPQWIGTYRQTH